MDGVSLRKMFYGHLSQNETGYTSPERSNQVKGRKRQGHQQEGPAYNIDYDRKPPEYDREPVEARYQNK